jgi:hypothetical protein
MEAILRNTSEQWTGETAASLFAGPVQQDGNYIFFELGADLGKEIAGQYKEFGTARQAAEPFLRPSLTELRRTGIKRMLKALFERMGRRRDHHLRARKMPWRPFRRRCPSA